MRRIALVTGGNRGIGRAAAEALAATGTDVILTYHSDRDEASAVVNDLRKHGCHAAALQLDTTQHNSFGQFRDNLLVALREMSAQAKFDILVNNSGFDGRTPFGQTEAATIDALHRVHVKGPILLTELLEPHLRDGGRILFVSTGLTRYVACRYRPQPLSRQVSICLRDVRS